MKSKIANLFKISFVRNVLVLATGTAAAQAVAIILSPVRTRIYGPEAFGILGTFNAMLSIITPVAALTFPMAIVLPKKDQDAIRLIKLSLLITAVISIISIAILTLFNKHLVEIFNLKEISSFLFLIPLVVVFSGILQVAEQWLIRTKQFSINARVTFMQSIIINGGKAGIGFFYPIASVLVIIAALGNGLKALMMIVFSENLKFNEHHAEKADLKVLKKLAKTYYDFPLYRAPEVFINATSNGIPVLMLTAFFGPAAAGFYALGRTILSIPTQLIGKSVGDVFYPRIAEAANNNEDLTALIKKATLALSGVGIIPYGLIILLGPTLFSFIFGSDWATAGEYARWIALWSFFGFINKPSVKSLPVLNAQRFQLIYTIIMLITRLAVIAIGYFIYSSDIISVALFGISGAILNIGLILITLKISINSTSKS